MGQQAQRNEGNEYAERVQRRRRDRTGRVKRFERIGVERLQPVQDGGQSAFDAESGEERREHPER